MSSTPVQSKGILEPPSLPETPFLEDFDVILIDAYSLLFRAFHSFPLSLTTPDGQVSNAVYGFTRMLLRLLEQVKPEFLVVAIDMSGPTFRHQSFTAYKQNREEAPAELTAQIPLMIEVLEGLNVPTLGMAGFEADDIIGTVVQSVSKQFPGQSIGILTGDRDLFQLIEGNIFVLYPSRDGSGEIRVMDREATIDKLGVLPEQVVDYKALCGDASDNIPGVKGIGPKTAVQLLSVFKTLENLYQAISQEADAVQELKPSVRKKLTENQEMAFLSQQIARIDTHAPIEFSLEKAKLCDYDKQTALELFDRFGFDSLKKKLPPDDFESAIQETLF